LQLASSLAPNNASRKRKESGTSDKRRKGLSTQNLAAPLVLANSTTRSMYIGHSQGRVFRAHECHKMKRFYATYIHKTSNMIVNHEEQAYNITRGLLATI
jgi:hypothetical protein